MARILVIALLSLICNASPVQATEQNNFWMCVRSGWPTLGVSTSKAGACTQVGGNIVPITSQPCNTPSGFASCGNYTCAAGKVYNGSTYQSSGGNPLTRFCSTPCAGNRNPTNGACVVCDVDETFNTTTYACDQTPDYGDCPEGFTYSYEHNTCSDDGTSCAEGHIYDVAVGNCRPECSGDETYSEVGGCARCPAGTYRQNVNLSGSGVLMVCVPDLDEPPEPNEPNEPAEEPPECPDGETRTGYIGSIPACGDDLHNCVDSGGSVGSVDPDGDGPLGDQFVCIPDSPDNSTTPKPNCTNSEALVIDSNGRASCEPIEQAPNEQPEVEGPPAPDIDGDGIPDHRDGDMDGDGTPNGSDSDADGDGVPNVDDKEPLGDDENGGRGKSEVAGGGNCTSPPVCKGDAIDCAVLRSTWELRCGAKMQGDAGQCDREPTCTGSEWQCALVLMNWRDRCGGELSDAGELESEYEGSEPGALSGDGTDLADIVGDVYGQTGEAGACPAPASINVLGETYEFSYEPLCDVAEGMRPFVIIAAQFIAFIALMRAF